MTQRASNQENSLPTSNEQLYACECAEYYGSHHPECPARQQFDRQRAEIERRTRERDAQLGAILTILLDKVVSLDREINELRVLTVTSDGGKVSPQ